jgi:hypothetical protein
VSGHVGTYECDGKVPCTSLHSPFPRAVILSRSTRAETDCCLHVEAPSARFPLNPIATGAKECGRGWGRSKGKAYYKRQQRLTGASALPAARFHMLNAIETLQNTGEERVSIGRAQSQFLFFSCLLVIFPLSSNLLGDNRYPQRVF